jgi:hypothetical protein
MTRSASSFALPTEFDEFLLAPIGEDRNGMLLSVLSALARMGIDPWEEAANLAKLPRETATRTLALLIAALPGGPSAHPDPETIAPRLIALLPRPPAALEVRPSKASAAVAVLAHRPVFTYVISYLIFMIFVLVGQWFMARVQPPAQVAKAPIVLQEPPPPSSGK